MPDTSALAALVVAGVALLVAAFQLTQQTLATAYVIRKCDQVVTAGLTKGAKRQWHWRQFRFTVTYHAIVFALPQPVYFSLGISSTIQVDKPSREIWERASRSRSQRTSAQGCWISFVQDLATTYCLLPDDICTREESGDRIPDDLTVAPTRVDAMTVLLSCIAMGMQVFKYSPTTHEITLAGGVGSISSSTHPVLGGLLHYSVFSDVPTIGLEAAKRHAHALHHKEGVWANAVFGRFRDRSYRPVMIPLDWLMEMKIAILLQHGWSEDRDADRDADTIGGAASFMAFGHVDVYEAVPPSVFRRYATHFAEVIVKAHHVETLKGRSRPLFTDFPGMFRKMLEDYGYSSPYLPPDLSTSPYVYDPTAHRDMKASTMLVYNDFLEDLQFSAKEGWRGLNEDYRDPSSYCPSAVMWQLICLADNYMSQLQLHISQQHLKNNEKRDAGAEVDQTWRLKDILSRVDAIVARSIRTLSNVGAPSWGDASDVILAWPRTLQTTCDEVLSDLGKSDHLPEDKVSSLKDTIRLYAELSILRSAYFTVMMRAAHPLGPGLNIDSRIETALAYMA